MNYDISLLHVGIKNTIEKYPLEDKVTWKHVMPAEYEQMSQKERDAYQVLLMEEEYPEVVEHPERVPAYSLIFVQGQVAPTLRTQEMIRKCGGVLLEEYQVPSYFANLSGAYYSGQYGSKFHTKDIQFTFQSHHPIAYEGNERAVVQGNFGEQFTGICSWRTNIPVEPGEALELWLEYTKSPQVEMELRVYYILSGTTYIKRTVTLSQADLSSDKPVQLPVDQERILIAVSLEAKGKGELKLGNLHYRYSHLGDGTMIRGGQKAQDSGRNEFYSYFNPGDFKPPLAVYFSGYRTAEGFEGYNIMKSLGCPFLLIGDPRLEGGAFYMGSEEFELKVENCIRATLGQLGFTNEQLIISGISMGSTGAIYYGAKLLPHTIIVGKPLLNIGSIAENEKIHRPGGFPTSLDVLKMLTGGIGPKEVEQANAHMWNRVEQADFSRTSFAISYMREDDYDRTGYQDLIAHLSGKKVFIYGKGMTGRHNDNTGGVVEWFMARYRHVLKDSFGR